jgi:hypothetical protein
MQCRKETPRRSTIGRCYQRYRFSLVAPVDPEISPVDGDNAMPWMQFAHPDQTQIGKIGMAIGVSVG